MRALAMALLLVVGITGVASAQNARRLVREALAEFERGNYEEARALFLEAYELEPSARILRGAGMASFEARAYLQAYRLVQRSLAETERPLNERQRAEMQALLERVETFLGRFTFVIQPESAEITIDLRPVEREADGSVLLDLGEHQVAVRADGYRTLERRLEVVGGEVETVELRLDEEVLAPAIPQTPTEKHIDGLGWALIGGGSGLLAGAIGTLVWWVNRIGEVDECRDVAPNERCLNLSELQSQRRGAATTTMILTLTGALALTTGILRWSWSDDRPVVACGADPSGGACSLQLRF